MSKFAYRLAAALFVAGLAGSAVAETEQPVLDIHAEDYNAPNGSVKTLFVAGVGMVEAGQQAAAVDAED
jgi:hypothetical protein